MRPSSPKRKSMRATSRSPRARTTLRESTRRRTCTSRGRDGGQRKLTLLASRFLSRYSSRLNFDRADGSMTYSNGVRTPSASRGPTPSTNGTVISIPGIYSSTRTPCGYCSSMRATMPRRERQSLATESSLMPLDEPSKLGFTMAGMATPSEPPSMPSSLGSSGRSRAVISRPLGESMPCALSTSLVSHLSSVTASV